MAHRLAIYRDFIVHRDVDRPATEFEPRALAKRGTININGDNNRLHPVLRYRHHRPSLFLLTNFTDSRYFRFSHLQKRCYFRDDSCLHFVVIRLTFDCFDPLF